MASSAKQNKVIIVKTKLFEIETSINGLPLGFKKFILENNGICTLHQLKKNENTNKIYAYTRCQYNSSLYHGQSC